MYKCRPHICIFQSNVRCQQHFVDYGLAVRRTSWSLLPRPLLVSESMSITLTTSPVSTHLATTISSSKCELVMLMSNVQTLLVQSSRPWFSTLYRYMS